MSVDAQEAGRKKGNLVRLGRLGEEVVLAIEAEVRKIVSARAAATFILVQVTAAVLNSEAVLAAWVAVLRAQDVPENSVTLMTARCLFARRYLHSQYASVKRQIWGGHQQVKKQARARKHVRAQVKAHKKMVAGAAPPLAVASTSPAVAVPRIEHKGSQRSVLKQAYGR